MSQDSTNQLLNFFRQLVKQLDTKFASLEKQLDKIEANMDNFRTFNERSQNQLSQEINQLKQTIAELSAKSPVVFNDSSTLDKEVMTPIPDSKPIPKSEPVFSVPQGPPPLDQYKPKPPTVQMGFSPPPVNQAPPVVQPPQKQPKGLESQYGGLKETPILEALKEESLGDETYFEAQAKKKKVRKQTLRAYLEKLEAVVKSAMPVSQQNLQIEDYNGFIDKGLTVVHGIIEFLFVAYRMEFPDANLDYYAKAKNLSGQGLFKDVSLLEKLESLYNQIESDEKPVLARPLLRGFNERITKLYEDFESKIVEAYVRL